MNLCCTVYAKKMRNADNLINQKLLLLLIIFAGLLETLAATSSNQTRNGVTEQNNLLQRLQNSLPKYAPPDDMRNNTVHIFLDLYQITDVNEQQGVITVKLWLYYYYYSDEAKWNSSEFQRQVLLVPKGTFWEADISPDSNIPLEQVDLAYYKKHDEWELMEPVTISYRERTFRGNGFFDQMVVEVNLKREHLFYSVIFMLPNMLLYILSSLVYLIPPESGEKLSLAITILLAAVVSFGTISDILPASSRNFPVVAVFVGIAVTQMTLDTILTAVVLNIHFLEGRCKMGYRCRKMLVSKYMVIFGLRPCPIEKAFPGKKKWDEMKAKEKADDEKNKAAVAPKSLGKSNWIKVTNSSSENSLVSETNNLKKAVDNMMCLDSEENMQFLWQYLARLVDRILLFMHILISVIALIWYKTTNA